MKYPLPLVACPALFALSMNAVADENVRIGLEDLRAFTDAWGYIRDRHVEDVDDRQLLEGAIRGMIDSLDPHSKWLSPEEFQALERQATGRYGGLGIRIGRFEDHLQVVTVFEHGPAAAAGIEPGDRIVRIDGIAIDRSNVDDAPDRLRGEAGSPVSLSIRRDGHAEALELELQREVIQRDSVTHDMPLPGLHHLRIDRFQQGTAGELDRHLDHLESGEHPVGGLIIDLRNNPGGILQIAIATADRFLSDRLVVSSRGRGAVEPVEYRAEVGERLPGVPLIVLVDRGSASGAEILAGALRDHGRAIVMGEPTYGKGSVQTIWPLGNGSGIRLTTALYYTPAGHRIQARGIEPDVHASASRPRPGEDASARREAGLPGHLAADTPEADQAATLASMAGFDPVLHDALRLLQGMQRLQSH